VQKNIFKIVFIFFTLVCAITTHSQTTIPEDTAYQNKQLFYQEGKASYYHKKFQGRKTASGEIYNRNLLTAAHKELPFGTKVKVTNIRNRRWVIVRINDRGPYSKRYKIDLSYRAAKHLGITKGSGWTRVIIEEIPENPIDWQRLHIPEDPNAGMK